MLAILAAAALLHGRVANPTSGQGLSGVLVSNGRDIVATGASGEFALPEHGRFVFVIKPAGWADAAKEAFHLPLPVAEIAAARNPEAGLNFLLRPQPEAEAYDALVFTDPQPANDREIGYLRRSLTAPLAEADGAHGPPAPGDAASPATPHRPGARPAFGLTCGDITYDRPDLYPEINAAMDELRLPWFTVNGNHDLTLGVAGEHAIDAYESFYGPSTYAFRWGPALFIALNDVRHEGGPRYHGGLLPDQWTFLANLLADTPVTVPVVIFCHIPLFAADPFSPPAFPVRDRLALFALLRRCQTVLILSGHTHTQRRVFHTTEDGWQGPSPLLEYNVAAACGGFWGGPLDSAGAPISTMSDGTPPGYAILHVSAHALSADYHLRPDLGPDTAPSARLRLHLPRVVAPRQSYVPFFVNLFDGSARSEVRARVDDGGWIMLRPLVGWDPSYAAAYLAQDAATVPLATPRMPEPSLCFHLWRGLLPAGLDLGPHSLTVQAGAVSASAAFEIRKAN